MAHERSFWRRLARRSLRWLAGLGALGVLGVLGWLLLPRCDLYPPGFGWSQVVRDRSGVVLHLTLAGDGRYRLPVRLAEVPEPVQQATLGYEDRRYWSHPGVDPLALGRALSGVLGGSPRGGGSTLTMQVARLRFGLNTRSVGGKLEQIFRAVQLERHYSKAEILEAYYNLAPYGGNVEGLRAAAMLWCGKEVGDLSLREGAALTVIPQSPTSRRPRMDGSLTPGGLAATRRLLALLEEQGLMRADPMADEFRLAPRPAPRQVPHLARRLCRGGGWEVATTIDRAAQQSLEATVAGYLRREDGKGLRNACALVVDAPTRQVRAYLGSAGFLDESILGQVDGVIARRSPGSLVKPFVYGLAVEEGLIHPRSLLSDAPLQYTDYAPENFEREFMGPVFADEALARSRNVPAVALSAALRRTSLYEFLVRSGVRLRHPPEYYGLALCLGGFEISPERVAQLYAALASDGIARPLAYSPSGPAGGGVADGLSEATRFVVRSMLRRASTLGSDYQFARADPEVAWKTGTSHGFRDAWAAGIRGRTVVVVWLGNFDGSRNPALVGRTSAAPLLFEILGNLTDEARFGGLAGGEGSDEPPDGVRKVEVCATSGMIPVAVCPHRLSTWFIPGVSPIGTCTLHRKVWIDAASGERVLRNDGRPGLREEVREYWSPEMLRLFRLAGVPRTPPPVVEAGSMAADDTGTPPRILSPIAGRTYVVDPETRERRAVPLRADCADGSSRVFWFADGAFIGSCASGATYLWEAPAGEVRLQAIDDAGRASEIRVAVRKAEN